MILLYLEIEGFLKIDLSKMKDGFWISLNWDLNSCIPKKKRLVYRKIFKQTKLYIFYLLKFNRKKIKELN
jgi:hypothetical protein